MLGCYLAGIETLQRAGHLVRGQADVGAGQGPQHNDMLRAFDSRHLLSQGRRHQQSRSGQQNGARLHAFPFYRGLEQTRYRRNLQISRFFREFFPNGRKAGGMAKMPRMRVAAMSLRGQFFLSVVLALVLSLSVLGVVALRHARTSVDNEMRKALEASDRIVDNALLSLPQDGRDGYLERLVRSFDDNRHVRVALTEDGREIAASHIAGSEPVPAWYQRLLEIPVQERIDSAPRLDGRTLRVITDAHNEIGEAWTQFRDGAAILGFFSLLVLGLLHFAMARVATPLKKLSSGFEAVGSGNYAAQVRPQGPREISSLADAFNRMTARLDLL